MSKAVLKQAAKEFGPPLGVAIVWIVYSYFFGFDKNAVWVAGVRDFAVAFFMISWFWNQYNRIEYQTGTRDTNQFLRTEVGKVKETLISMEQRMAALAAQPVPAQSPQFMELSDLIRSANNHVDAISAKVNTSIGEFTSNATVTVHSNS